MSGGTANAVVSLVRATCSAPLSRRSVSAKSSFSRFSLLGLPVEQGFKGYGHLSNRRWDGQVKQPGYELETLGLQL